MDPITIGLEVVGLGMSVFGGMEQSKVAHQQAEVSADVAKQQQQQNLLRKQQMELENSRSQMENVRNFQRARAMATNSAVNQGAQFGSGLMGGYGQISGQANTNGLNLSQNLQLGQSMFNLDDKISQDKIKMAQLGGDSADAAGWASLGGSMMKAAPTLGNLGQTAWGGIKNAAFPASNVGIG